MLNPTGLVATLGTKAYCDSLRDRRKWLVDNLDSWSECYQSPNTTIAALILHHFGYVSLDINISDLHLVGGRSTRIEDTNFAVENLKLWANSEISNSTMSHVHQMMNICYDTIESGTAGDSSYEIAAGLFTGGLVCWAYGKLKINAIREEYGREVSKASLALRQMGCWKMCVLFGRILNSFEAASQDG